MATQAGLSPIGISKILLATDFSPESQNALQYAVGWTFPILRQVCLATTRTARCRVGIELECA